MPLYEYQCDACGKRFEIIQKFSDPAPDACRVCGKGPVHRLMSSPAIQFKGTGWYITDYAQKGKQGGSESSETKSDGKAAKPADASGSADASKPATPAASPAPTSTSSTKTDGTLCPPLGGPSYVVSTFRRTVVRRARLQADHANQSPLKSSDFR
jgi:putative FmdB family regulatory protein